MENNNKSITSIEWLESQLTEYLQRMYKFEINQAKEMEKQQQGYSEEDMFIAMGFASAIDNNIDAETKLGLCTDFIKNFKNKKI